MWVKFELTGALEEQFKELCEEECRTLSQQGFYIIKQYLKNNCIEQNVQENNVVEQVRTDENKLEQTRTNIESKEPKMANIQAQEGNKQEQIVSKTEQIGTDENKSEQTRTEQNKSDDFGQMEDDLVSDVLNF